MARTTVNDNEDPLFGTRVKLGTRAIIDAGDTVSRSAREAILQEFDVRRFGVGDEELSVARSDRVKT